MNTIKDILMNNIVTIWIAPIITTIIASIIIIKIQSVKNNKLINEINTRYLNDIKEYIINNIRIKYTLISDIRKALIAEYKIKEKYIYSELGLRNKLIIDITENKYINHDDKIKLINFTYDNFKYFENDQVKDHDDKKEFSLINKIIIGLSLIFLVSSGVLIAYISSNKNRFIYINTHTEWVTISSIIVIIAVIINTIIIVRNSSVKDKFMDLFFEEITIDESKHNNHKGD